MAKKTGKCRYGYKNHYVTDNEDCILGVVTTKVSRNEIANLEKVLKASDIPENIILKANKGYHSRKNEVLLAMKKMKNYILNKSLINCEKKFNKLVCW